jgi:ribosome-binding ATPase
VRPLSLLSGKPRLYVANVGEETMPDGGPLAQMVAQRARDEGTEAVVICAQCEADLADWPPDEADEYRADLGLEASGLERLIYAGYRLLDLITFFTATGTNVVRAWTLRRGETAYDAAGKIHTDMQKGFIRAEVISYTSLMAAGNFTQARERGWIHLEGREYVVQDGDIIHVRFSPPR